MATVKIKIMAYMAYILLNGAGINKKCHKNPFKKAIE